MHRTRQAEERLNVGPAWKDLDLIFPSQVDTIMFPQGFLHIFRRILVIAHLPRICFHDLRHTPATLLLARGVNPKMVSERLGHLRVKITLDVYSHVTPHMQQLAADVMDLIFQRA